MTTGWLLDTNIVSEAVKPQPSAALLNWLGAQPDAALHIAALTLAEIRRGILEKAPGRRRRALEAWFAGPEGPQALFAGRILAFDDRAALAWARLMVEGRETGRPRSALDMIIAATAEVHRLTIVTANERHFRDAGVAWINPVRGEG
ncbi:type II toxin-antitoxin system VapC family toxin [Paracraurococcus lichenis]|uniref:Ribonuclease VapC n=1 Tax=Paracraurococcus lichenis TaxID=3064888 RepID=A0ABT9DVS3_9PROT|nr:type II toxin-antitoxin system VapC family toxin [Paracraurococcus sp. LOR1-02]MDO9707999.1 type II toxin-antitoxin system VapC family toxin [Paracraurococcus sp. LOR1-02]